MSNIPDNEKLAKTFDDMAIVSKKNKYKKRAYINAADSIRKHNQKNYHQKIKYLDNQGYVFFLIPLSPVLLIHRSTLIY